MKDSCLKFMKTPCFVFEKAVLKKELESLETAISRHWSNTVVAYSFKTNSLPYLAKFMNGRGVSVEVVSQDEYDTVVLCGYKPERIVCNGPIKSEGFVAELLENKVVVNLDSHSELDSVKGYAIRHPQTDVKVGLRVNLDVERHFPGESKAGDQGSRFGFCADNEEFKAAVEKLAEVPNIKISGLHIHVSTSTRKVEIYRWLARNFVSLVKEFNLCDIEYFDMGGGFFGGLPDRPGWNDYLSAVAEELGEAGFCPDSLQLIMEPGVSLLAGAFSYYMKVTDVKVTTRSRFVVMDGSRIHIDPLFHKTGYFYERPDICDGAETDPRPVIQNQKLVGFTCLEYDNLMDLDNCPEFRVGDVVRCCKLGAYTLCMSPLFISFFPAVYMLEEDGSLKLVREKWTASEFVSSSVLQ